MPNEMNENFCPICEQIIQTTQERIEVKVNPSRTVRLHEGCANLVKNVLEEKINNQIKTGMG